MSRQYSFQFTASDSGLTFNSVMTVDTATNIVTDLYELSDPNMTNLINSGVNDPRVYGTIDVQYRNQSQIGYDPNSPVYSSYEFTDVSQSNLNNLLKDAYEYIEINREKINSLCDLLMREKN